MFIAIGHVPATELFATQLDMKPSGYIKTAPFSTATSVPGVFAANRFPRLSSAKTRSWRVGVSNKRQSHGIMSAWSLSPA